MRAIADQQTLDIRVARALRRSGTLLFLLHFLNGSAEASTGRNDVQEAVDIGMLACRSMPGLVQQSETHLQR
jgi:hypothetical protein